MQGALVTLLALALLCSTQLKAGNKKELESRSKTPICRDWWALADPHRRSSLPAPDVPKLTDAEAIAAIGCLLDLEGKRGAGRFSGATRFEVSQSFPQATVELDALFLVSAIYQQRWAHADGVALVDSAGKIQNPKAAARRVFPFVREWYRRVKEVGIEVARRKNDHPLSGSGLHWY